MDKLKCAVIGVGYLGKFHAEKYHHLPQADLVGVCDVLPEHTAPLAEKFNTTAYNDYRELLGKVDAVSIVVPTYLHFEIAKAFLEHGTHVLLEKPITTTIPQAEELIDIAERKGVLLQVGHLERFNPAFLALEKHLDNPSYIESIRLAPFKSRGIDVNVILDLMIHDIDIVRTIVKSPIKNVTASGAVVLSQRIDLANAHIQFENGCVANVTASRVNLSTKRKLRIYQHQARISLDLQNKNLTLHRKGENEMFPGIPEFISETHSFEPGDALMDEIREFLNAIADNRQPIVSGEDGKIALATAIEITKIVRDQVGMSSLPEHELV